MFAAASFPKQQLNQLHFFNKDFGAYLFVFILVLFSFLSLLSLSLFRLFQQPLYLFALPTSIPVAVASLTF